MVFFGNGDGTSKPLDLNPPSSSLVCQSHALEESTRPSEATGQNVLIERFPRLRYTLPSPLTPRHKRSKAPNCFEFCQSDEERKETLEGNPVPSDLLQRLWMKSITRRRRSSDPSGVTFGLDESSKCTNQEDDSYLTHLHLAPISAPTPVVHLGVGYEEDSKGVMLNMAKSFSHLRSFSDVSQVELSQLSFY